ncbi:MBL fold metallo-hydrolase [Propionivibrio limicola]|uniref:MBL fold metallo-hydrolase n=1 Tax=Propionivibrio limicola TaxID=167645 RepID=UPI0012920265|nr:MBL fold metallo-hydrolase [Propionivibrio limicola]
MRFASLGSGSQGNSLIVDAGDTKILLDCGFSMRSAAERLARLDVACEEITAVLVTHEHGDHVSGVSRFAARYGVPVHLTHGTHLAVMAGAKILPDCRLIDSHSRFSIGDLEIFPFPVPHDAREPVQFVFSDGNHRLGVLTDAGTVTPHVVQMLDHCDALVLECNHDPDLLASSDYPAVLKRRIAGNYGHLDNAQAAALLQGIETGRLQHVVAAHLSEQNNRPHLAATALAGALGCAEQWIDVADQGGGFGWRQLV